MLLHLVGKVESGVSSKKDEMWVMKLVSEASISTPYSQIHSEEATK